MFLQWLAALSIARQYTVSSPALSLIQILFLSLPSILSHRRVRLFRVSPSRTQIGKTRTRLFGIETSEYFAVLYGSRKKDARIRGHLRYCQFIRAYMAEPPDKGNVCLHECEIRGVMDKTIVLLKYQVTLLFYYLTGVSDPSAFMYYSS